MSEDAKAQALQEKELGNGFYKQRKFQDALEHYQKAIELDPLDITFLTNKAAVYFEMKEYDACIAECQKAIDVGRENRTDFKLVAKALSRMASAYAKKGDYANARTYYEKSLTEHRLPETLTKLSEVSKILKEEQLKAYIDPAKSLEEKTKGNEYFQKADWPRALKHYDEAIKRNPTDAKIYSNRAACYMKLVEFPTALKDCEECIKLDPTFGYIRKGMALLAMKEHSKATAAFQKALEIDPNNQEAIDGYRKCTMDSMANPDEVRKRAMNDPEVQRILGDPAMRMILEQMQSDPKAVQDHLRNPEVARKIEKLMEAGLIGIR